METCRTCNLQNKQSKKCNHEIADTDLAAKNQHFCRQYKQIIYLVDRKILLQFDQH